jgi:hypothetical protein
MLRFVLFILVATVAADARTWVVNQAHRRASDKAAGTESAPFRTISRAAELAQPGDTVLVHGGVYRERVSPARGGEEGKPVLYQAAPGEEVVVRGSEVWKPAWTEVREGVLTGGLGSVPFGEWNPYRLHLTHRQQPARPHPGPRFPFTLGQVFVDGAPYREVATVEDLYRTPATWITSADGNSLLVHFDRAMRPPRERLVEISVRGRIFAPRQRGLGYIHVKGFVFEHCANPFPLDFWTKTAWPQMGALSPRTGHHWVIEHNTVRHAKGLGLDIGSEGGSDLEGGQPTPEGAGYHMIRNNHISDNGAGGIQGLRHTRTQIIGNVIERNNALGFKEEQWEQGGIKTHFYTDGLVEGNLIRDNEAFGIWLDNVWDRTRVTRNVIVNNLMAGVFLELGNGPGLVDNNIIAYTREGDGIYAHDASGITIAHNLIYGNAGFGIWMHVATDRQTRGPDGRRAPVTASRERVLNNILIGNRTGAISFPFPFERASDNVSDWNLFVSRGFGLGGHVGNAPLFSYNTSGTRVKSETVVAAFQRALAEVPQSAHPNLALWAVLPYLSLDQWRLLSGNDKRSQTAMLRHPMLRSRIFDVDLDFGESLPAMECPPVEGVDRDYFGNPIGKAAFPGPFQRLEKGLNRIVFWPVM